VNRRGFFAALVTIPGAVTAKAGRKPERIKYLLHLRYGKFADPTAEEMALAERYKRENAEIERQSYYGGRAEFFLAT
jgi:hypothetical protein